jgi:hypothetical protein
VFEENYWRPLVNKLADQHKIKDRDGLLGTLQWASIAYDAQQYPEHPEHGKDTLDKVQKTAAKLLELLSDDVNRHRIIDAIIDHRLPDRQSAADPIGEIVGKFEEMLAMLDAVRLAAASGHRHRERGRPAKEDLRAAYDLLAGFWIDVFDQKAFTQTWQRVGEELEPTSPASWFLYEAIKIIDPRRPGLGESLQALMVKHVSQLPGERRGRRRQPK